MPGSGLVLEFEWNTDEACIQLQIPFPSIALLSYSPLILSEWTVTQMPSPLLLSPSHGLTSVPPSLTPELNSGIHVQLPSSYTV